MIAIASGASVTTALVNLHLDAERKLSTEFRTLGPNVLALPSHEAANAAEEALEHSGLSRQEYLRRSEALESPQSADSDPASASLMNEDELERIAAISETSRIVEAPYLYAIANVTEVGSTQQVILAGTWLDQMAQLAPWWKINGVVPTDRSDLAHCLAGQAVAKQMGLTINSRFELHYSDRAGDHVAPLTVSGIVNSGGQEDNQVIANLPVVQNLISQQRRIGLIQLSIPGTPGEVERTVTHISAALPDLDVRPIPQIAQAEGQLLPRIQGLIYAMVALILVLTVLCVFASMTALAMERRRDVGLMKAIGGKMSRVVAIFLTEAGALGLAGALIGYVVGIFLSRWIGWRAFGVGINARPEVLPLVVALMVGVALAGAFPLRLLGRVRPAEILRGE
ncbi:MAG TPA: ABC transporter permease [Candidatus Acidoferrum sp.]|nr:ABC transporter permease [Candidatus Acidoferrum sp.]